MKPKLDQLDTTFSCPFTKKTLRLRFVEPDMYPHLIKAGYSFLFEEEMDEKEIIKTKTSNDISK